MQDPAKTELFAYHSMLLKIFINESSIKIDMFAGVVLREESLERQMKGGKKKTPSVWSE